MKKLFLSLLTISIVATGCANNTPDEPVGTDMPATEDMQGMEGMEGMVETTGNVDIALVSPTGPVPTGDTELVIAVQDPATGEPVATENLKVDVLMEMDGTDPMTTEATVTPGSEPGTYTVNTYLGMAGPWMVNTSVEEGDMQGTADLMVEAQ
ncbi:MAG: FixH family protein [Phormidesmis sp.]